MIARITIRMTTNGVEQKDDHQAITRTNNLNENLEGN
jgi:hypothetical protein